MRRASWVLAVVLAAGCGSPPAAPEDVTADRGDAEPPPATIDENEGRVFDVAITTRDQETIQLRDCVLLAPDSSFFGGEGDPARTPPGNQKKKHPEKVFDVALEERSFVDALLHDARRELLDETLPARVRPVLFTEVASVRIDPVRDYRLPVTITFRSRKLAGLVLTGTLTPALGLKGSYAQGLPATVALREAAEIVFTERPR